MANELHTFNGNEIIATEVPKYLNDNFSALNSVDEDIKTQLGTKAPLASPTLTGTPKAPTASAGTNTTQIATTAFVASAVKVKSVNGKTGDVVVDVPVQSVNGKTGAVTIAETPYSSSATSIGDASATKPAVVVTSYRSGNSWYRVYSDKWVEQGGVVSGTSITFHKAFANTNYNVLGASTKAGSNGAANSLSNMKTTGCTLTNLSNQGVRWYACGVGA